MSIAWHRRIEAALQLTRASAELRLLPSSRTIGLLGDLHTASADEQVESEQLQEAVRVGRTVARVSRHLPWHPTCLRQALAAQRMLRRRGIDCRLHLGVASAALREAHAWVTVAGEPVLGFAGLERYVPLAAFR